MDMKISENNEEPFNGIRVSIKGKLKTNNAEKKILESSDISNTDKFIENDQNITPGNLNLLFRADQHNE